MRALFLMKKMFASSVLSDIIHLNHLIRSLLGNHKAVSKLRNVVGKTVL